MTPISTAVSLSTCNPALFCAIPSSSPNRVLEESSSLHSVSFVPLSATNSALADEYANIETSSISREYVDTQSKMTSPEASYPGESLIVKYVDDVTTCSNIGKVIKHDDGRILDQAEDYLDHKNISSMKNSKKVLQKKGRRNKKGIQDCNHSLNGDGRLCSLCKLPENVDNLGYLYGPYNLLCEETISNASEYINIYRCGGWVHEDCVVWAPGVYIVGSKLVGLQEAISDGINIVSINYVSI